MLPCATSQDNIFTIITMIIDREPCTVGLPPPKVTQGPHCFQILCGQGPLWRRSKLRWGSLLNWSYPLPWLASTLWSGLKTHHMLNLIHCHCIFSHKHFEKGLFSKTWYFWSVNILTQTIIFFQVIFEIISKFTWKNMCPILMSWLVW